MTLSKEVQAFVGRIRILGWIAIIATLVLIVEVNLIVTAAWANMDMNTQLAIFGITFMIVLGAGFTRIGPDGFLRAKRRKRKR